MNRWLGDFLIDHPRFLIFWLAILGPVFVFLLVTEIIPAERGAQENFQTLRSDLTKVHLPSGYRLKGERKAGTDCHHDGCSLTQTWTWVPALQPTQSSACFNLFKAMNSAFSDVESNSPLPANAACDYYSIIQ